MEGKAGTGDGEVKGRETCYTHSLELQHLSTCVAGRALRECFGLPRKVLHMGIWMIRREGLMQEADKYD